ncbi:MULTISPECIES: SIR2 family protein, partial [Clostridia]|uniref:SIR2 family protein n=1 Tax=Clostridia TaxID=186801 RepID=UPI0024E26DD6
MNSEINAFINKYVKEIRNNNAAFFAGAGFSKESGYVDWKTLLEFIASELGLEVEKEHDLVALAQYCYNKHQNRGLINDVIFEEFSKQKEPTQNHRILARLPIGVIWTTNYDDLIEKAFDKDKAAKQENVADFKKQLEELSTSVDEFENNLKAK